MWVKKPVSMMYKGKLYYYVAPASNIFILFYKVLLFVVIYCYMRSKHNWLLIIIINQLLMLCFMTTKVTQVVRLVSSTMQLLQIDTVITSRCSHLQKIYTYFISWLMILGVRSIMNYFCDFIISVRKSHLCCLIKFRKW